MGDPGCPTSAIVDPLARTRIRVHHSGASLRRGRPMRTREAKATASAVVLLCRYRRGTVSSALALLLLGVFAGLVPLAHASPPDPTWIAGFYDGADFDDVVLAIVSLAVASRPPTPAGAPPEAYEHRLPRACPVARDHRPRLTANRSPPLPSA